MGSGLCGEVNVGRRTVTSKLNLVALEKASTEANGTMNRKAYWGVLALVFMALAILPGCSSSPQSPPPGQVVTVTAVSGYAQYAYVGMPYGSTFSAMVLLNGSPVGAGQTVTFTAPTTNGATGTFANGNNYTTTTTDATGTATSTTFTANTSVGTFNVVASTGGTNSTATFYVSNTTTPAMLTASAGGSQSTTVSTAFGTALTATVTDSDGNDVVGIPVTFTVTPADGGASGYFSESNGGTETVLTNSSGVAAPGAFNANATAGSYTVTATVVVTPAMNGMPAVTLTATYDLTNNAAAGALHRLSVYPKQDELEAMNNGISPRDSRP
jgi:hypothetical protein